MWWLHWCSEANLWSSQYDTGQTGLVISCSSMQLVRVRGFLGSLFQICLKCQKFSMIFQLVTLWNLPHVPTVRQELGKNWLLKWNDRVWEAWGRDPHIIQCQSPTLSCEDRRGERCRAGPRSQVINVIRSYNEMLAQSDPVRPKSCEIEIKGQDLPTSEPIEIKVELITCKKCVGRNYFLNLSLSKY